VGGCVRDLLLGRPPQDYDLATDATPEQVLEVFPGANRVGAHFGVVLVTQPHAPFEKVEIATFRSDQGYEDGRHPVAVRFERDPAADARRRDFTINGLFMDPDSGEVFDFVGGRADLAAGVIRAIGDPVARFDEDHLRLMRAIRFAARFRFTLHAATQDALRECAAKIHRVAIERVRDELSLILTEGGARYGLELMDATGLLFEILPEVVALHGVQQPPEYHPEGDVWVHTMMMLEMLHQPTIPLALGVLLHDIGKPGTFRAADRIRFDGHVELGAQMARAIVERLRYSSVEVEQVVALVANHMRFRDAPRMKDSTLKRFLRLPRFAEHLELHRVDCAASSQRFECYEFVRQRLAEWREETLRPPRLLTGADLMAAGFRPGEWMGRILNAVEEAQLNGEISSREEALQWVARRFSPP
jgi:poly(A) polymerase